MKIPVFVSSPTKLNPAQLKIRLALFASLEQFGLEPRALGQSDYPTQLPLREVLVIARHCAGALILGFEQQFAPLVDMKRGLLEAEGAAQKRDVAYPTPWNNLEAGILYGLGVPMLVFKEQGISGGIFDAGVSDVFIHPMPPVNEEGELDRSVNEVFLKWQANVRRHYYGEA